LYFSFIVTVLPHKKGFITATPWITQAAAE